MGNSMAIVGYAACAALMLGAAGAGEVLDTVPLEKTSITDVQSKQAEKSVNRQNEEKFPPAEKLDPAGWFSVDLKPHCNVNVFSNEGRTVPLQFHHMELGRQVFYGVPFEIVGPKDNENRTAVGLPSTRMLTKELPPTVEVPVGRKAAVLYFLHATYYTSTEGEQYYVMNYEDGTEHKFRFVGTKHSGDWYHQNTRIHTEDVRYVLVPSSKGSKLHHRNLHILQWTNPDPDKKIKSIAFKSDPKAEMAILVVAVTGHPGGGGK